MMPILFIVGKILFGGYFVYNGVNHLTKTEMLAGYARSKNVPWPTAAVVVSGLMILLGGMGVLLGVYPKLSLALIALFLLVVSPMVHDFWAAKDPAAKMADTINFTKNMALLGAALMLMSL